MYIFNLFTLSATLIFGTAAQISNTTTPFLNITTIAAVHNASVLQCWQISHPFATSGVPGTAGSLNLELSDATNISYTIIPSRFDGGVHTAPTLQYVVFLSGLAHVTLPNTTITPKTEAWVQGGKYGLILAADTKHVSRYGHVTRYPSDADTVTLSIPIKGSAPAHRVLYEGPCQWAELVGL